jgi:4-hydroxy-L-threonine phosphate dehydrogenase PdxA
VASKLAHHGVITIGAMNMATTQLPRIAIASGDPAGIGPEISLKAALDTQVRRMCRPLVVGDPMVLETHARAARVAMPLHIVAAPTAADWTSDAVNLLAVPMPGRAEVKFATNDAAYGQAALASCSRAIRAALDGDVEAVVAAPQNQTSIAAANIPFDGHPTFVAREIGMNVHDVFMMLWFGNTRIVHCTLHVSVAGALALITLDRVIRAIQAARHRAPALRYSSAEDFGKRAQSPCWRRRPVRPRGDRNRRASHRRGASDGH